MDTGHMFSSYHLGRLGAEMLEWSGATKKEQLIYEQVWVCF
jgi:hypothetical protein